MTITGSLPDEDRQAGVLGSPSGVLLHPASGLGQCQVRRRWRRVTLPVNAQAARSARHVMRFACVLWSVSHLYDTAAACVTELVTNAVEHVQWPDEPALLIIQLTVSIAGPYLVVEVSDPDRQLPVIGGPVDWDNFDWSATEAGDGHGERGFGLHTVATRLYEADGEFGLVLNDAGKTVFFALPVDGRTLPKRARSIEAHALGLALAR